MNKSGLRSPSTPSKTAPSTITNADNIQVVCRVRPLNSRELSENAPKCISVVHDSIKQGEKVFTYNQVFGELSKQQDVFNAVGNPVIDGVFQGFNGTIFAYGQTGSGKTHTMMGPDFDKSTSRELWGIIPRAIETIFNRISNSVDMECSVHVSFFEIYNEKVNDLLDIKNKNIDIRQANTEWEEVLSQKTVNGFQAAMHLLEQGVSHRKTGSTDMNAVSSRSHSIFVISLKQTDIIYKRSLLGKLYLVDLAGSEKQKKTNSTGERFKEGTNINKSLFVLSRVIHALTEGIFVPYRDAVLTKVLKNSLGGNCKTALVINVSPANSNEGETKSTLEFGSNAKKIKNDPRVNTTDDNQELSDLKGIIESQRVRIIDLTRQLELVSGGTDISFNASFSSMDLEGLGLSESFSQSSVVGTGICSTCGKELEEQEKQLKSKVTELSATIKALKEKVKKGESTVLVYQKRLKDQEKMDAESKKIKDQIEVHAYWKRKQVDLTDEIKKLELEIPKIVKQHSKVKNQYQEALNSLEADEDILNKLQEQFETTSAKVVTMKNEFHKMTDKQKELTSNSSRSECALKEKQELQTNAKAMIDKISKENERLSAQLATMEQDLTKYNEQYQVLSMSVQSQKKSNEMVEASLLELNHKRDELNKHSDDMQSEINGIAKDISDLEQHKRNLLTQIDSEKRVLGTLSSQLSEATSTISCQRGQLEELQQQEETIVNELGMLEAKLISLNDTKQRLTRERLQVEKSIPTLMEDLKEQNLQKKTLEEQLSIAQEEQSKLTEQTTKMRESIELTKRSEQEYNRILSNSESENATRKMEVEKIKQEIDSNNEQKKFFECQYGILKIQVDSLQQKISDMKFLKTQLEENSTSLNEDLTTLTNRFNTMESEKNHLLKNTAELKSKLKQLASDQSSCQHELAHTTRILEESQSTLSMNKEVLVATKQELQTVKQELERKKAQLNNLNGQVLSNSEQVQSIQQRNDTLRKSIEQLEVEHKDLAEKLRIERENIAREKQIHFEKLMEEEQQRREMERKRREEVFLQNSQERKLQDDRIATEINDYNSRLEVAIREMQQEMSNKMLQLSAQSQDFERRILAITRRKRDLNMEFQFQTRRDSTNSFSASDDTNTNFDMSSISAAEVNATN